MDNLVATTEPLAMASLLQTYLDEISFIDMLTKLYKRKQELVYKIMPTLKQTDLHQETEVSGAQDKHFIFS